MNQDIEQLKNDVSELKSWRDQKKTQQVSFPLDVQSANILSKYFLKYDGQFNSLGVSGNEFPLSIIFKQDSTSYYLTSSGNFYRYSVDPSTDTFTVFANPFSNGDAVTIYTENQEPAPLVAGGSVQYYVVSVSGNTFKLSLSMSVVFTVSGISVTPTSGAVYTDGRSTYVVSATSISGGSGTITCTATGKPYQTPGIVITKDSGTGDSSITASSWTADGGSSIDITSSGVGKQYMTFSAGGTSVTPSGFASYASGTTTWSLANANATQNIAHGLSSTPAMVRVRLVVGTGSGASSAVLSQAEAVYTNGASTAQYSYIQSASGATNNYASSGSTIQLYTVPASAIGSSATLSADATNIKLAWTSSGGPSGTVQILWEAMV